MQNYNVKTILGSNMLAGISCRMLVNAGSQCSQSAVTLPKERLQRLEFCLLSQLESRLKARFFSHKMFSLRIYITEFFFCLQVWRRHRGPETSNSVLFFRYGHEVALIDLSTMFEKMDIFSAKPVTMKTLDPCKTLKCVDRQETL